jgi:hypothetical protein
MTPARRVPDGDTWGYEAVKFSGIRPRVVEDICKGFSTIDIHDHIRQGSLD